MFRRPVTAVVTLFVVFGLWATLPASHVSAETYMGCPDNSEDAYVCRVYSAPTGMYAGVINSFQAVTYPTASPADAKVLFEQKIEMHSMVLDEVDTRGATFGDEHALLQGSFFGGTSVLVFLDGDLVVSWTIVGEEQDYQGLFERIYTSLTSDSSGDANEKRYLPGLDNLPGGFELIEETDFDPANPSANDEPTRAELEATIAALEKQLDEQDSSASTSSGGSDVSRSSGPLELLDVTARDAGIGDGTRYVYVDVRNTTSRTLDYVQVDVTCRDSGGRVVATGIGNTLSLGAGQSTVLTAIVLSAPTCESVDVSVNPLTGGF